MLTAARNQEIPWGEVEIVLQTNAEITWWKQVKVRLWTLDSQGRLTETYRDLPAIETRDQNHGPVRIRVDRDDMWKCAQLIFSKARGFGIPGEVYKVWGWDLMGPYNDHSRFTFTWQKN